MLPLFRLPRVDYVTGDAMVMTTNASTSVSLSLFGEPIPQPRMRFRWVPRLSRVISNDPAKNNKIDFENVVRRALADVGVTTFPVFGDGVKLKVLVTFHVFNRLKDIDNLLKFFLDSLQSVLFKNNRNVFCVVAMKILTMRDLEFTEFQVENIIDGA